MAAATRVEYMLNRERWHFIGRWGPGCIFARQTCSMWRVFVLRRYVEERYRCILSRRPSEFAGLDAAPPLELVTPLKDLLST